MNITGRLAFIAVLAAYYYATAQTTQIPQMSQVSQLALMSIMTTFISFFMPYIWASIMPMLFVLVKLLTGKEIMMRTLTGAETDKITPKIWGKSHHGLAPLSLICGKWFIGVMSIITTDRKEDKKSTIIALESFFISLELHTLADNACIYEWINNSTNNWHNDFTKTTYSFDKYRPMAWQEKVCNAICQYADCGSRTLICGPSNVGKSKLAMFVAEKLLELTKKTVNVIYLTGLGEHGTNIQEVVKKCKLPGESLIIVVDEIDTVLVKVLKEKQLFEMIKTTPNGKNGWNALMDSFERNPNLVHFIFTSNKTMAFFEDTSMDRSLMRENRINIKCDMSNNRTYAIFDVSNDMFLYSYYMETNYGITIQSSAPLYLEWKEWEIN